MTKLKERRLALGLSLRYVAAQSGVSYGSVWNYENDRHSNVIQQKYQAVVSLYDRLQKERAEAQEKEEHVKP